MIDCEFSEVAQEASCVLVYREYDSPLLTVVDIPHLLHLPVSLTVDSPENYTFALFGKHPVTGMEEHPVVTLKGMKKKDSYYYVIQATYYFSLTGVKQETEDGIISHTSVVVISIGN